MLSLRLPESGPTPNFLTFERTDRKSAWSETIQKHPSRS